MTDATALPRVDAEEVDDYRIVRPLGQGGGTFLAHDRLLDRAVVISFLPEEPAPRAARLAVARAFARVSHPNLGRVHRVREGGARPYVVAAFARGRRLDSLGAPLPEPHVLQLGRGLTGALAALHGAGIAHGDVHAARVVVSEEGEPRLVGFARAHPDADREAKRRDVRALVALLEAIAGPDLQRRLGPLANTDHGVATPEALRQALESFARPTLADEARRENPYRGLRPFEADDAPVFFGREREVAELVERLRAQPWLVVAGRSGAGKSSLVAAGLAPAIARGALGERATWDVAKVVPGARPVEALASVLAQARSDRGLLVVVDPLEEAMTLATPGERAAFSSLLERFGTITHGVRVVLTLRSDFLDRLVELGALGRDLARAAYIVPPMSREGLREAIVAPARARGVELETPAMADALIDEVSHDDEALPLLSFALAELWDRRDAARRVLPRAALRSLGGAVGALANQGELVLARLAEAERIEARRILVALVTAAETRERRSAEELVRGGNARASAALEALVRGRLVVAGETYALAHDALVRAWPRLRAWLDEASDARAAAARLAIAAKEWDRLRRAEDSLWNERQLRDLDAAGGVAGASDVALAFVAATRMAVGRVRRRRALARFGVPSALVVLVVAIAGAIRWSERRADAAFVAARLTEADTLARDADDLDAKVEATRADSFAHFDADDVAGGEARWAKVGDLARRASERFGDASARVGLALARDPLDARARSRAADLAFRWLLLAERDHQPDLARDLRARLAVLDDDGSWRARLDARARLRVTTSPPGASVLISRVQVADRGRRVEDPPRAIALGSSFDLDPGSYVLSASAPGRYATRYPILLGRAADERVDVVLPTADSVPADCTYVPAGTLLAGAADVASVRDVLGAQPEHPVRVSAFFMGKHEVTYAEYLAFLATLSPAEREARRPHAGGLAVVFDSTGAPALTMDVGPLRRGEPLCRPKRSLRRCQDWTRFPVAGVSWDDARAYAGWFSASRAPGARLCTDREWEHAARGADDRLFPFGDELHAGDANFNSTYGADEDQMGVDEVGSFPLDVSPFGVVDLAGNVGEWVAEVGDRRIGESHVARGGPWSGGVIFARTAYRFGERDGRSNILGVRLCLDAPSTE